MAKDKLEDSNVRDVLDSLDELNPYATYLDKSTLSTVSEWIDTGSLVLNSIISGSCYGGIPVGRMTLFAGESKVGKSLFIQKILANAQKRGLHVIIFDTENAIDNAGATRLGLDTSKVKYIPCKSIEQTRNSLFKLFSMIEEKGLQGKFIVAIDSFANLLSELDLKRMDKDNVSSDSGTKARAMKTLMQLLTNYGALTKTTVIGTNHVYDDPMAMFPSLEKHMPGGKSMAYLPSVTVQLARKPVKEDGGKSMDGTLAPMQKNYQGLILRALTCKNRFIKQYLEAEMYLSFDRGLDRYYGLLDLAVGVGAIVQTGSTYTLPDGTKLGHYSKFRKNKELWDNQIIPKIEESIKVVWAYGNTIGDDEIPYEIDEEIEEIEEE